MSNSRNSTAKTLLCLGLITSVSSKLIWEKSKELEDDAKYCEELTRGIVENGQFMSKSLKLDDRSVFYFKQADGSVKSMPSRASQIDKTSPTTYTCSTPLMDKLGAKAELTFAQMRKEAKLANKKETQTKIEQTENQLPRHKK